jgi:hypothetical protein
VPVATTSGGRSGETTEVGRLALAAEGYAQLLPQYDLQAMNDGVEALARLRRFKIAGEKVVVRLAHMEGVGPPGIPLPETLLADIIRRVQVV